MSNPAYQLPFNPSELALLPVGDVDLGVPLHDDNIQIGDFNTTERARLLVSTNDDRVTRVVRMDGSPLQVEVVAIDPTIPNSNGLAIRRHKVFEEPIDELLFIPTSTADGKPLWLAQAKERNLQIANTAHFEALTITIGSYALRKLHQMRIAYA